MQLDDDGDRPRTKRPDDDDDDGSGDERVCDWCRERCAWRVSTDCVRAASPWLAEQLAPYSLGHRSCVYSACVARVPRGRSDLLAVVRALLEADGAEDIRYVPPGRARPRHAIQ
jgi:hypothetical protein